MPYEIKKKKKFKLKKDDLFFKNLSLNVFVCIDFASFYDFDH